ncbi:MAG: hypothetical protein D6820_04935, partial [Lentisphaerae bacterium]
MITRLLINFMLCWLFAFIHRSSVVQAADRFKRDILVCTTGDAPAQILGAVQEMIDHPQRYPALAALLKTDQARSVRKMNSEALLDKKRFRTAAFNHLLIVGMIDRDPLLSRCWGQEVHLDLPRKTLYTQGFGWFCGEVGIIRSDRNPFLHSQNIKSSECETVIIKISGTTPKAVLAALRTFQKGYVNALVPAGPYTRPQHTILDQDPVLDFPGVTPPSTLKDAIFAGWHQIPANEY